MSKQFDEFLASCEKAVSTENNVLPAEFVAAARQVGDAVETWGVQHGIMSAKKMGRGGSFFQPNAEFVLDQIEQGLGPNAVAELIASCNIPECYKKAATRKVAAALCQTLGKEGNIAFVDYNANDPEFQGEITSLESLYGADLWDAIQPATEAFGINMDRVTPDLKTILTVSLLQFHVSLTPRMVPIQSVTQSNVQITREMMDVFDMTKPDDPPTRVIDLYRDPAMVSVRATRIEPLLANSTDGALQANGIYSFEKELNLFKLAKDSSRPGYETFNHTDIVEDNIMVDGVLVEITKAAVAQVGSVGDDDYVAAQDAVTEKFLIALPTQKARLTQINNDYRSTERRLTLDRTTLILNAESAVYGSTSDSTILSSLTTASGKFLSLGINLTAHVDRKTAAASASCWGVKGIRSTDPDYELTTADTTFLNNLTVKFLGFTLDARYNEDNKRKTSIRAEINRRNMSYELPAGRNFVIDFAIGQEGAVNAAARLSQLEHIGRDGNNLKIVTEVLQNVHDQRLALGSGTQANVEIATPFAAGDMVHQTAYIDNLDFSSGFLSVRSADGSGDIKQFVKTRLNKIITGLLQTSLLQTQLAEGTPVTMRMITSPYILGAILSCHHIHAHLDNLDQRGSGNVEYVLNLDCGVKLECVTTTFSCMDSSIVIIPFFENAPTSVLNFGTDFDQGTLVGAITLGADNSAAHNRMFSTTRECLIPTNVIGAIINVTGLSGSTTGDNVGLAYPGVDVGTIQTALGVNTGTASAV